MKTQIPGRLYGTEDQDYPPGMLTDSAGYCTPEMTGSKTVVPTGPWFKTTGNYRVLIDPEGVGHIRIIRRINFRTFILVFREVYLEIRKNTDRKPHIVIHLSRSLSVEMSGTLKIFLDFSQASTGGIFRLCTVE
jgi:hypothetical protein